MGKKGDKMTSNTSIYAEDILERLISIDNITSKKMFGGYGIFYSGLMFGMISPKTQCLLKVDESNIEDYTSLGSEKHSRMPYYTVPDEVLENKDLLIEYALKSIAVAEAKKK